MQCALKALALKDDGWQIIRSQLIYDDDDKIAWHTVSTSYINSLALRPGFMRLCQGFLTVMLPSSALTLIPKLHPHVGSFVLTSFMATWILWANQSLGWMEEVLACLNVVVEVKLSSCYPTLTCFEDQWLSLKRFQASGWKVIRSASFGTQPPSFVDSQISKEMEKLFFFLLSFSSE